MARTKKPELYVVDGSNIATEGRSVPSLEQLNEAVLAFIDAHPDATVTVVVDATFGHRIAKKEVKAFDEAVANNELVTPPAGAVGRGDAFVLAIADRAGAGILSNDSFQEFHGEYEWLFDDGRLIGGKPVPHVGWVFVKRSPVRGPKSRQAVREANGDTKSTKERANRRVRKKTTASDAEAAPAAEPATDEPAPKESGRRGRRGRGRKTAVEEIGPDQQATIEAAKAASGPKEHVNDLMPFLEFVEHHPVGTSCNAVVESYASHGAYARMGDVLLYIPMRLMDDPPPRSARSVLDIGEAITAVIVGYVPDRRSIDAALPHMARDVTGDQAEATADGESAATTEPADDAPAAEKKPARKRAARKKAPAKQAAAAPTEDVTAEDASAESTPAKKAAATKKTPSKRAPSKRAPSKRASAKTTAAKKAPAAKTAAKKAPAKQAAAKQAPAKKTAAKQAPAKKTAAKRAPAKKTAAKRAPAKKTAAKQAPAKKAPAKKAAAKRAPAKKTAAKKTAAKKTAAEQSAAD